MAAPVLDSLAPDTVDITSGAMVPVTITGSGFLPTSILVVNGSDDVGQYVSATEMTTDINTFTATGNTTLQIAVRNDVDVSNELPLALTGTSPVDNPDVIPDTPPEGASPNTEAVRAEYHPPDPPDVYRLVADPQQSPNLA